MEHAIEMVSVQVDYCARNIGQGHECIRQMLAGANARVAVRSESLDGEIVGTEKKGFGKLVRVKKNGHGIRIRKWVSHLRRKKNRQSCGGRVWGTCTCKWGVLKKVDVFVKVKSGVN